MILVARKRPIPVQAIQYTGTPENLRMLREWSVEQVYKVPENNNLKVQCLEALAETPVGSYIVKGVKGEVWPVREDIFNETYEILQQGVQP